MGYIPIRPYKIEIQITTGDESGKDPGIVWSRVSQNLGGDNKFLLGWVTKYRFVTEQGVRRNNAEIMQEIFTRLYILFVMNTIQLHN